MNVISKKEIISNIANQANETIDHGKKTFKDFDKIGLEGFCKNLINYSVTEYSFVDESLVISLNGKFGSGKSCFLEMMKKHLEDKEYDVISVDVWKNDFFDDPFIPLAFEMARYLEEDHDNIEAGELKNTIINIASAVGSKFTGVDFGREYTDYKKKVSPKNNSIFDKYKQRIELFQKLNESLNKYIKSLNKKPLFILVDELDRSRPDYMVKFLETLKHFFQTKGIVFILGVNESQLESSVKCLYGDLDFSEYYRKFIHRSIVLPSLANLTASESFIESKIEEHKARNKNYVCDIEDRDKKQIKKILIAFKLTPRQIDEFFGIFSCTMAASEDSSKEVIGVFYAIIIYTAILLNNKENAQKIRNNTFQYKDYLNLFQEFKLIEKGAPNKKEYNEFWAKIILFITTNYQTYNGGHAFFDEFYPTHLHYEQGKKDQKNMSTSRNQIIGHGSCYSDSLMCIISKKIDIFQYSKNKEFLEY